MDGVPKKIIQSSTGQSIEVELRPGFLKTPKGKEVLAALSHLPVSQIVPLFDRFWSHSTIEKAFSYHGIRRERPAHINYDDDTIGFIIEGFKRSHHLPPNSPELFQLKEEIIRGVAKRLKRQKVTWNQIACVARDLSKAEVRKHDPNVPYPLRWGSDTKSAKKPLPPEPALKLHKFPDPPTLQITKEAWEQNPGEVRVGAISRIDWKDKGARAALAALEFQICAWEGCHYNVLNGGLVSKRDIQERIDEKLEQLTPAQRRVFRTKVINYVLMDIANELNSIIPIIKKPPEAVKPGEEELVRLYIMPSLILDGAYGKRKKNVYGEEVARLLQGMRPDIRLQKTGGDTTRLKGIGVTEEEAARGQIIRWINPTKHRLPGQYASTAADKEIREEEEAAEYYAHLYVVGGYGSSISKPGGGERKRPFITLPVCHIPMPRREGEPSIALNQIGVRIIKAQPGGKERLIQTWSLHDLATYERLFVTGIKEGATEVHKRIVEAIKREEHRRGLTIGELADALKIERTEIEQAVQFLLEPRALKRTTWPGLYFDPESGRYNFHRDWFQDHLRYPWPYDKDYLELKRLVAGCLHAGYNTTDYEYFRRRVPKIIVRFGIKVFEIVGDLIAGLKHHQIHRGQVFSGLGYTEQEIFAAELVGTVMYDVFVERFEQYEAARRGQKLEKGELESWIAEALLLFIFIVGNHDAWQEETGHIPGYVFKSTLISILNYYIGKYLLDRGLFTAALNDIIETKVVELPEHNAVYTFPGGLRVGLVHPRKGRTKTASQRAEEALDFCENCHVTDSANYHTAIVAQKWHPDLGQREAIQVGAFTPFTYYEQGQLKRVDFGPIYSNIRYQEKDLLGRRQARIFMTEHMFFSEPILTEPISKNTNIDQLKESLGLLRARVKPVR